MIDETQILGTWTHSHEEDHDQAQTYRLADYPFPPARGRTSFTLTRDHHAKVGSPGSDDRGARQSGTWSIENRPDGDVLKVECPGWTESFLVLNANSQQLVLQPIAPSQ